MNKTPSGAAVLPECTAHTIKHTADPHRPSQALKNIEASFTPPHVISNLCELLAHAALSMLFSDRASPYDSFTVPPIF